ncbi:ABC transporter ATP-binding protein [Candidatus Halobonum tyrrellensis]|uniref:Nickel import system ATP-binding protein NikD n=1 Tax=Candidatus Halobonum tyrrellensis G22 TaxID=1324957 RepID=V4HK74_9EURY|nr:ABC transporter ATP-binding protein [Candidatus Halobonum tyrrellensis]ESP90188.1 peptide ABC transporter ATP-binding protein [Candidatus Halobonum tyrrellensis G22]
MATQNTERRNRIDVASDNVLEIENASVGFAMDRGDAQVLNNVSIDVHRGEVLGVVGESGSGKSMLADSMLDSIDDPGTLTGRVTFHPPEGGDPVVVNDLNKEELRRFRWERISMVVQGAMDSFNPTLTVGDHFEETLRAHDYDVPEGMERARDLLEDVHLDADRVLDSYPHQLSGGMTQRALIALSLILDPDVLVMDEPTAALDLLMQQSILKLLAELKAEYDLTVVIVTHDLSHVARISDRLAVMYAFELLELGPVSELVADPAHPYTRELLNSIPDIDADLDEMGSIEGTSPDPLNVPEGCSYHPRCPIAKEKCVNENPDLFDVPGEEGHGAACFYIDEARETIPLKKEVTE